MIERINSIIRELSYYDGAITSNLFLAGDLGIDSLRMVGLIAELEDIFSVTFNETDLDPDLIKTVYDVYKLTAKYLN